MSKIIKSNYLSLIIVIYIFFTYNHDIVNANDNNIKWLPPKEAAKIYYSLKGFNYTLSDNVMHPTYLFPYNGFFGDCNYDQQNDIQRYYECVYSICSLIIQNKYNKNEILSTNSQDELNKFIMMCPKEVKSAQIKYTAFKEKQDIIEKNKIEERKRQIALQEAAQKEKIEKIKNRENLAKQLKDQAVSIIKNSRPKLFSDSNYPTIGEAFNNFFASPKKWQGNTIGSGGKDIAVAFEGIAKFNGKNSKFVIWFTDINPELIRENKPIDYNFIGYINGIETYNNSNMGNFFADIYLNN